ncbi:MAG TPA: hypothetical protein VLC09_18115 [Polyangiaceae bacterium]|nr:hypothetical protein [Polyangiaceae bacterium]
MSLASRTSSRLTWILLFSSLTWAACSSDDPGDSPGDEVGGQGGGGAGGEGTGGAGTLSVEFTVPAEGGKVAVKSKTGTVLEFTFPASAAGKTVKLTPGESADLGWPAEKFGDVVHMEPDGLEFAEPVVLKSSKKKALAFSFPTKKSKSRGEPLELTEDKKAHKVKHFSSIAYLDDENGCEKGPGWVSDPQLGLEYCYNEPATSQNYLYFDCTTDELCGYVSASCCTIEGATSCSLDGSSVDFSLMPLDVDPATYPQCTPAGMGGIGGETSTGGAPNSGGAPNTGGAVSMGGLAL